VIPLRGELTDELATTVIAKMLFLQFEDQRGPITLLIDSPGGSVSAGMAVVAIPNPAFPPSGDALAVADVVRGSISELTPATIESLGQTDR